MPLRGARLRRRGTAAAFWLTFRKKCFAFFAAKPQSSKIYVFPSLRRIGNFLAAFCGPAGCALAALWARSGPRARLPARPDLITIASLPAARLPLRRSCSRSRRRPGEQAGRPQAELLKVNYKSLPSARTSLGFHVPTCRGVLLGALFLS